MEAPDPSLNDIQAQLTQLKSALDVQKEIAALRAEVNLQLNHFKWAAWTAGVILAVLSFFGVKAWNDLTGSAQRLYEKQLVEMQERYSNLSRGFSYVDSNRTREAIPFLVPLFEANRYDEPVVRALLYALQDVNDCHDALRRVTQLRQDESRFMRLKDAIIYNQVASILRDCTVDDSRALEDARTFMELSLKRLPADDRDRRFPLYGLFTYHFIRHDLKTAERYLREASQVQEDFPGQESPSEEPWFKALRQRKDPFEKELEPLWNRVIKSR